MTFLLKATAACLFLIPFFNSSKQDEVPAKSKNVIDHKTSSAKIQAAILLDVSNSMDGLIEQAKAQLWNMVSVMGQAKCNGQTPQIEIALYEYGSPRNDVKQGYVKQISAFTTDLDNLSAKLFALTTNGGDEYCGHVIYSSIDELKWDTSSQSYKVIFIAGNEDFLQGDIQYTKPCDIAKQNGIIVNTIYCGDKMQGIREHWNLLGECGNGSFTNIDQSIKEEYIQTPYDSAILTLNTQLNGTYVSYGWQGDANKMVQYNVDRANSTLSKETAIKRTKVKGNKSLYRNSTWDMVDAYEDDSTFIAKVDMKTLPDSLKNKSREQLKKVVEEKRKERGLIQDQITTLNTEREKYLVEEKKKKATNNQPTLETETEKIIRQQAKRFNMVID